MIAASTSVAQPALARISTAPKPLTHHQIYSASKPTHYFDWSTCPGAFAERCAVPRTPCPPISAQVEATLYDAHQVPNAYELRHEEPALRAGAMNLPPFFEAKLRTMLAEANDLQAALAQLEGAVLGGDHVGVGRPLPWEVPQPICVDRPDQECSYNQGATLHAL